MKNFLQYGIVLAMASALLTGCAGSSNMAQTDASGDVTYQTFYDNLSPYGTWIDYPGYGHVWNPRIDGDFRPYATNGHWAYSHQGWAWASGYSWGWAPFHYGRWLYDDMYGWLWIPGYDWSPAWVTWGMADNFYCWAPIMPGVNLSAQFGGWQPHSFYWNVCSRNHIYDRNVSSFIERPDHVGTVVNHITVINNFNRNQHNEYYAKGPEVADVQKYTGQKIEPVSIKDVKRIDKVAHSGNTMKVYRPNIKENNPAADKTAQHAPQPSEFRKAAPEQIKPINTEPQKPVLQRTEQRANVERLPVMRNQSMHMRSGGGGRPGGGRHR